MSFIIREYPVNNNGQNIQVLEKLPTWTKIVYAIGIVISLEMSADTSELG